MDSTPLHYIKLMATDNQKLTFHLEVFMSCCCMIMQIPYLTCIAHICLVVCQKYSLSSVICRLLLFAVWISETERGRDRARITLPLNKHGKKGRMSASGNHKTGQGRLVFAILFLNSLIHGTTPPPFLFIQGDSISILVQSLALPINSSLPCVGP